MQIQKKKRFFITVSLLLVSGFLAVNLAGYLVSVTSLRNQMTQNTLPLTSDNIYSVIQNELLRPVFISSLMANDTFVKDWVLNGEKDPGQMIKYLAEIQHRYETISCFFVSEKTHNYYHHKNILKQVSTSQERDVWYFRVRNMTEPYEINVDFDMANRDMMTIFINYRVLDYHGDFIGATGVGLTVNQVNRSIENYRQRFNREIYFIDEDGLIKLRGASSDHDGEENIKEYIPRSLLSEIIKGEKHRFTYHHKGKLVLLHSRYIPELKWYLMVEQGSGEVNRLVIKAFFINLGICVLIIILVLWISQRTLSAYQKRLEEMATIDPLTGLFNRQTFELFFTVIMKEQIRQHRPLSLLMLDIDYFKEINDNYGHQAGDLILKKVAELIGSLVRESDLVGRWGGEEFLILLKDCDLDNARLSAEKIRQAISELHAVYQQKAQLSVTVSIGVARHNDGESVDQFIDRVDQALYVAKNTGRNCIKWV